MTLSECARRLTDADRILLVTHLRPDGDTLGSAAALCRALRSMDKTVWLYDNPGITSLYREFVADYLAPEGYTPDFVVTVDLADTGLFPTGFEGPVHLSIDHHASNAHYAGETMLMPQKAACGEVIYDLIRELGLTPDRETADLLYIAVATDCGCFVYDNTTPDTLRCAADLMLLGADSKTLNKRLFRSISRQRAALEGLIYEGLSFYKDGVVCIALVTVRMVERAAVNEDDCEDLAGLPGRIAGVRLSATIRELPDGSCKVSMRSAKMFDSCAICRRFGGGGHPMASGCTIEASPEEARRQILAVIEELYP